MVTQLLEYAVVTRASDIHLEPYEAEMVIRYRIDGVLHEVLSLPPTAQAPVTARIKILSAMRIDERVRAFGMPPIGLIDLAPPVQALHRSVDRRFELLRRDVPAKDERPSEPLRLGDVPRERVELGIARHGLGLAASDHEILLRNLMRPHGMILVTGPTGAGKSTSLYAMLRRISVERQSGVNISTVEDPIEYTMPRVNQIPLNVAAGFDFASALRALLRQDPDVIMVGEIRDRETVEIGVRAALVGRLFLSTLHTNDATAAVPRLLDMGVEPFLLASTLVLVVAQRLARRICVGCRESESLDETTMKLLRARPDYEHTIELLRQQGVLGTGPDPLAEARTFRGKGCEQCRGGGFRGRVGIFELFEINDQMRQMIMERQDGGSIRAAAAAAGMRTMFGDGLAKVFLGETTLAEVYRVAM